MTHTDTRKDTPRAERTPLTIVFTDHSDRYNGRGILRSHLAEYVQESGPDTDLCQPPTTLCSLILDAGTYRYAPSRQAEAFARCDTCAKIYNSTHDKRTPQFLGKPTRRTPPKLDTYTDAGRKAQYARTDAARFDVHNPPVPATLTPLQDDARKRERTRAAWLARARYEHNVRPLYDMGGP